MEYKQQGSAPPPAGQGISVSYSQQPQPPVVVQATGNCPNCRVGFINENFTACGIIWAICCFPCGLICLLTQKERKCINCGFVVS